MTAFIADSAEVGQLDSDGGQDSNDLEELIRAEERSCNMEKLVTELKQLLDELKKIGPANPLDDLIEKLGGSSSVAEVL